MSDQAQALRNLVQGSGGRSMRIVAVTSGKGGVGKSNFSLNFALALQKLNKRVLIFDADIGFANIDVLLGIRAPYNLYHLLKREKTIWEIINEGPNGLHFIAGGSGFKDLLDLSTDELNEFADQIGKLQGHYDVIVFDTGAGLSKETVKFIVSAQETVVVTTPEPTSITDAYALIKLVSGVNPNVDFKLVVNRAADEREGRQAAEKMGAVARRFLQMELPMLGVVKDDASVTKAVKRQVPFALAYPGSDAAKGIDLIARRFLLIESRRKEGGIKGFLQRLFRH